MRLRLRQSWWIRRGLRSLAVPPSPAALHLRGPICLLKLRVFCGIPLRSSDAEPEGLGGLDGVHPLRDAVQEPPAVGRVLDRRPLHTTTIPLSHLPRVTANARGRKRAIPLTNFAMRHVGSGPCRSPIGMVHPALASVNLLLDPAPSRRPRRELVASGLGSLLSKAAHGRVRDPLPGRAWRRHLPYVGEQHEVDRFELGGRRGRAHVSPNIAEIGAIPVAARVAPPQARDHPQHAAHPEAAPRLIGCRRPSQPRGPSWLWDNSLQAEHARDLEIVPSADIRAASNHREEATRQGAAHRGRRRERRPPSHRAAAKQLTADRAETVYAESCAVIPGCPYLAARVRTLRHRTTRSSQGARNSQPPLPAR